MFSKVFNLNINQYALEKITDILIIRLFKNLIIEQLIFKF